MWFVVPVQSVWLSVSCAKTAFSGLAEDFPLGNVPEHGEMGVYEYVYEYGIS
jgi:hypothetical protein